MCKIKHKFTAISHWNKLIGHIVYEDGLLSCKVEQERSPGTITPLLCLTVIIPLADCVLFLGTRLSNNSLTLLFSLCFYVDFLYHLLRQHPQQTKDQTTVLGLVQSTGRCPQAGQSEHTVGWREERP